MGLDGDQRSMFVESAVGAREVLEEKLKEESEVPCMAEEEMEVSGQRCKEGVWWSVPRNNRETIVVFCNMFADTFVRSVW